MSLKRTALNQLFLNSRIGEILSRIGENYWLPIVTYSRCLEILRGNRFRAWWLKWGNRLADLRPDQSYGCKLARNLYRGFYSRKDKLLSQSGLGSKWVEVLEGLSLLLITLMPVFNGWWPLIPLLILLPTVPAESSREIPGRKSTGLFPFWLAIFISAIFSPGLKAGITGLIDFSVWLLIAGLVSRVYSVEFAKKVIRWIVFSSLFWLGIGLSQLWAGVPTPPGWLGPEQSNLILVRIYSVFINPNNYALYLVSILVFSVYLAAESGRVWEKLIYLIIFLLASISLYFTFSRTAWIIGGAFLIVWSWRRLGRRRWLVFGTLIFALLILAGFKTRFISLAAPNNTLWYRIQIWRGVFRAIQRYWLWGTGPGGFELVYPAYQIGNTVSQHAHQLYLQLWLEHGIFGLFLFGLAMKKSLRGFFSVSDNYIRALMVSVSIFLAAGLSETWYMNWFIGGYFWFLFGLLLALQSKEQVVS
jgi:putative inorganic carbon (hco3(-)) transporter